MLGLMTEVTRILTGIDQGDPHASEKLLPLVYNELRRLAAERIAREKPGQTLEATALVHEAYLRLVDTEAIPRWNSRGHFFAAAAEAMRRILVEKARHKRSLKAGGDRQRLEMPDIEGTNVGSDLDLLALNEALEKLERQDKRRAQVVKLRFFAGLTIEETALALGISTSTADSDWAYARCWLRLEIEGLKGPESGVEGSEIRRQKE
jgi:RNA polymerase sigma factor (TIGR02999 family)